MKNFKEINRTFTVKTNSIFNAVCKTRYLALLVVLIFTCGNMWAVVPKTSDLNFGSAAVSATFESESVKSVENNTGSAATNSSLTGYGPFTVSYLGKNTNGIPSIAIVDGSSDGDDPMTSKYFAITSTNNGASVSSGYTNATGKGAFSFKITKTSKLTIGLYNGAASGSFGHATAAVYLQFDGGSNIKISAGRTNNTPQKWDQIVSSSLPSTDILEIAVVYNTTNSSTTYGGSISLAANSAHVYINGTAADDGEGNVKDFYIGGNTIANFRLFDNTTGRKTSCVDDIMIYSALPTAAASGWKLKGTFDSWGDGYAMTGSGTVSVTRSLAANTRYEFKIYDGSTAYGNNGAIVGPMSGWVMSSAGGVGNCRIHTANAGNYTFSLNTSTKELTVTYPSVTHPSEYYVYFKNSDVWGTVYGFMTGGSGDFAGWPGTVTNTTTICGETYHYAALLDNGSVYNKIIFNNGGTGYGNQTSDLTMPGAGKYNANRDANWHTFDKYTISYDKGTGTGGSMSSHTDLCPGSSQALSANAFTKDHNHFTGWIADVNVTINSATVTAGTLITGTPTIENVQSNITLTAQWEVNSNTLTWNWGGGSTTSTSYTLYPATSGSVNYGTTITYPANNTMSKTGYNFSNWSSSATSMPDEALTITASWTAKIYTITYKDQGGGDFSGTQTDPPTSHTYGTSTTLKIPTKAGFIFGGWFTSSDCTSGAVGTPSAASLGATDYTDNIILYAKWTDKGCTDHYGTNVVSGASTAHEYGPIDPFYEYSTRQILYTKTDLGLAAGKKGTIKSISFQYAYTSALTGTNSVKIYMANTDLTELSTSKYVTSFTEVYSGAYNCSGNGVYNEIMLDEPFEYDGVGNLIVIIDDNSNKDEGYSPVFNYHTADPAPTYAQLYTRSALTNADPTVAATWTGATETNYRPNTKFCIQEADMTPITVTLMDNGTTITEVSAGAGVTLPLRAGCTGYTFAGWTKTWVAPQSSWTTTAPTIIPAGSYTPAADENLYPVYTKTEGGGGGTTETTVTETFENQTSHSSETNWKQALTWDASESNASIEWTTYYGKIASGYTEIRTYNDNVMGYLWTSEPITGLKKVKFKGWHVTDTDAANMVVSYSTDNDTWYELGTHAATSDNSTFSDEFEITSSDPSTAYYLSIDLSDATCPLSSNKKYRIDDIVITTETGGGSTTYYISVPNCCTDWTTPEVTYSSSLAIGATATVTIGSGTTHGAVTYKSSNEDILTVESDGTITAVGAGTAHIIATWAGDATYCEKSANSNDISVSGIMVTGSIPVNFGQVYQNAVVANKTISVTGINLVSAITPSLPAGSPFSFSPASLAANCSDATLTISASTATLGNYNQTLTLTSGAFSTTVTVKMEVIAMPSCTFVDNLHNLTVDASSVPLSSYSLTAAQGTPVVFPTLANQVKGASTCEDQHYKFIGWTTSDDNDHPENHLVTSHNLENGDDITYYAVWADGVAGVSYTKLTSSTFKTSPTTYVLGGEYSGTAYYFSAYSGTDEDLSWGTCSSSDAPIQFTLSGTAGALVAQDASGNYLSESSAKKKFRMSSTSTTVELQDDGTIETSSYYIRYNYNSGSGGLRCYETTGSTEPAYFYEVVAGSTPSYRTSCCANKVEAPTVTATQTSTSITLNWSDETGATGWEVSWNGGAFGSPSGSRTHSVTGLTPNTTYTWQVRATYTTPKCGADIASGSTTTNQVYHVTYAKGDESANCNATGSTTDATAYEAGASVTLQANGFTLVGHTFNAWTTDDPDVTISSNQFTMPDHDVVITATWTAKVDKYFDRMHDQTDALHGGIEETESGPNEGKYYIQMTGCNYAVPIAVDRNTGDACQTTHYKLQGWIAASHMKGYPNNMDGTIKTGEETNIFPPTGTKTATGATYYAIWAEVTE